MGRHPVDHRTAPEGGRVQHFAEVERTSAEEGSHPAAKTLVQRPAERGEAGRRMQEFLRIDRGRRA